MQMLYFQFHLIDIYATMIAVNGIIRGMNFFSLIIQNMWLSWNNQNVDKVECGQYHDVALNCSD
jgi:hypothetical protein